ncbi:uncharacterized protein KY384_004690 [Bacidia gigantensis]|uniref:uncharacterized protein n=1 Tax=Bacidia gigantensis TaxID=2732470 RepID=UPI001D0415C9|nr:uncharacterized protein KY384_004690 [Bacidia gigantensis]KAG8530190.1 hypothetical protein KY384_004690 [Bacidia gigantensis]
MHFLTTLIALAATTTIITAIPLSDTPITTNIDTTQTNLTVEKRGWTYGWIGSHLSPNCDKKLPLAPNHKPGPYEDGHVVDPRPQLINNDEEHPEKSCREFQPVTDWIGWSYGSGNSGISTVTFYKSIADSIMADQRWRPNVTRSDDPCMLVPFLFTDGAHHPGVVV